MSDGPAGGAASPAALLVGATAALAAGAVCLLLGAARGIEALGAPPWAALGGVGAAVCVAAPFAVRAALRSVEERIRAASRPPDVEEMVAGVVRRHPLLVAGGAAAVGALLARALAPARPPDPPACGAATPRTAGDDLADTLLRAAAPWVASVVERLAEEAPRPAPDDDTARPAA